MALSKKELIQAISTQTDLSRVDVQTALTGLEIVTLSVLNEGGELTLPGIGKLSVVERAPRTGRNPRTGEPVEIAAKRAVKLTPAKSLKDSLN